MPDTFVQSFNQGFNIAHQVENDRRVADVARQQVALQGMQMQKMAQDMMQQQQTQKMMQDPATRESFVSQFPENVRPFAEKAVQSGNWQALEKLPKAPQEKPQMTLENILADKVKKGEMTLAEAIKTKKEQEPKPPTNINSALLDARKDALRKANPALSDKEVEGMAAQQLKAEDDAMLTKRAIAARSVFQNVPNFGTGVTFNRMSGKYTMDTPQGKISLTSEQVKNLGLEAKEQATTSDIRTMQQSAPSVLGFVDKLQKDIADADQGLGPLASRWREFKAGKIGLEDTAFTGIRTNMELLKTRLMKMHVGSRGSDYMMDHFTKLLDYSKQSPENLQKSLQEIKDYAGEVKQSRIPNVYKKAVGDETPTSDSLPSGFKKGW